MLETHLKILGNFGDTATLAHVINTHGAYWYWQKIRIQPKQLETLSTTID